MPSEPNPRERWEQVSHLYHAALARPAFQRAAFLQEACAGEEALRREVASLLEYDAAGGFLDRSPELAGGNTAPTEGDEFDDLTGRDIAGYRVTSRLGAGGMGVVYKAVDAKFQRPVAIKLLSAASADRAARRRFLREAQTASSLNHPHILTVHDIGELDGRQYLVTEFVDGGTLRDWAKAEPRTWQQVLDLLVGVADALATAHEAAIIHRDIKPQNILVSRSGYAKLADFGLAKVLPAFDLTKTVEAASDGATRWGTVMGTAGYMSPEQAAGAIVDARSDIFSFGVVLHEMLAGRRPFAAPSTAEELQRILHSAPDPLHDAVPGPLQLIVQKALEKLPERRYQSMRELLVDLRRVSRASAAELRTTVPVARRFRRGLVALGAGALAIAIGLFAVWVLGRGAVAPGEIRSIAVLPFQNLSGDSNQEYFSDGMTETLIANLAQIHALNVTSRTSVMQFKSTKQTIPQIGRTLGVDAIVESSVQRAGNRVRITAQLIRASTDTHLWAKEFNGSTSDLLELQSDIAKAIAEEIRVQITPEERGRLSRVRKVAAEAQDAFLLGRYQFWRSDLEGYKQAIQSYERAIELQPDYAAAYAGLSFALRDLMVLRGGDTSDRIRSAAFKSVELDPTLAEAQAAVGAVSVDDWEWERAEQAFRKAMELNPDSQDTCHCYAALLSALGRHAESVSLMQHSAKVNPLLSASFANLGVRLFEARRYQDAETAFRRALGMEPENLVARIFLAEVYSATGRPEDAVSALDSPAFRGTPLLARAHAGAGHQREARELLRQISPVARASDYLALARTHASLGEEDRAFEWLTKAFDARFMYVAWARVSPSFDVFRGDPRFDELVARLHLPG